MKNTFDNEFEHTALAQATATFGLELFDSWRCHEIVSRVKLIVNYLKDQYGGVDISAPSPRVVRRAMRLYRRSVFS